MTTFNRRASRLALFSLILAALAGPAAAADYVVVATTDPAVRRGLEVSAGQRLALASGRTATLMHASGGLVLLKGSPGGAVAPSGPTASATESDRMAVLRLMVSRPRAAITESGGRTRALCPSPASLVSLDAIAQAGKAGCEDEAAAALDAYIERTAPAE